LEPALGRVVAGAGRVVVPPVAAAERVRVALVQDPIGALFGLWEEEPGDGPS